MVSVVREGCPVCPRGSQVVRKREPDRVLGKSILGRGGSRGKTMRQEGSVSGQKGGLCGQRAMSKGGEVARNGGRDWAKRASRVWPGH